MNNSFRVYAIVALAFVAIFLMAQCASCLGTPGSRCNDGRGVVNGQGVCEPV